MDFTVDAVIEPIDKAFVSYRHDSDELLASGTVHFGKRARIFKKINRSFHLRANARAVVSTSLPTFKIRRTRMTVSGLIVSGKVRLFAVRMKYSDDH